MKVTIKKVDCLPCELESFIINDIKADESDFGHLSGFCGDIEDYSCINRRFIIDKDKKEKAMEKYNLSENEYEELCEELKYTLYINKCSLCD